MARKPTLVQLLQMIQQELIGQLQDLDRLGQILLFGRQTTPVNVLQNRAKGFVGHMRYLNFRHGTLPKAGAKHGGEGITDQTQNHAMTENFSPFDDEGDIAELRLVEVVLKTGVDELEGVYLGGDGGARRGVGVEYEEVG